MAAHVQIFKVMMALILFPFWTHLSWTKIVGSCFWRAEYLNEENHFSLRSIRRQSSFPVALLGYRGVKESKKHIWQKSYGMKLRGTKPARSNTLYHPGKVANAETNKFQGTPVHTWKSWWCTWSCSYYQLFWATSRKPSKPVGWSTLCWSFKPWPVQCSPYSSNHTNVTSQKEKVHVGFNLFFKHETKMPGINTTYTQHATPCYPAQPRLNGFVNTETHKKALRRVTQSASWKQRGRKD